MSKKLLLFVFVMFSFVFLAFLSYQVRAEELPSEKLIWDNLSEFGAMPSLVSGLSQVGFLGGGHFVVVFRNSTSKLDIARVGHFGANGEVVWDVDSSVFAENSTVGSVAALNGSCFVVTFSNATKNEKGQWNYSNNVVVGCFNGSDIVWSLPLKIGNGFVYESRIFVSSLDSSHFVVAYKDYTDRRGFARLGHFDSSSNKIVWDTSNIGFGYVTHSDSSNSYFGYLNKVNFVQRADTSHFVIVYTETPPQENIVTKYVVGSSDGRSTSFFSKPRVIMKGLNSNNYPYCHSDGFHFFDSDHFLMFYHCVKLVGDVVDNKAPVAENASVVFGSFDGSKVVLGKPFTYFDFDNPKECIGYPIWAVHLAFLDDSHFVVHYSSPSNLSICSLENYDNLYHFSAERIPFVVLGSVEDNSIIFVGPFTEFNDSTNPNCNTYSVNLLPLTSSSFFVFLPNGCEKTGSFFHLAHVVNVSSNNSSGGVVSSNLSVLAGSLLNFSHKVWRGDDFSLFCGNLSEVLPLWRGGGFGCVLRGSRGVVSGFVLDDESVSLSSVLGGFGFDSGLCDGVLGGHGSDSGWFACDGRLAHPRVWLDPGDGLLVVSKGGVNLNGVSFFSDPLWVLVGFLRGLFVRDSSVVVLPGGFDGFYYRFVPLGSGLVRRVVGFRFGSGFGVGFAGFCSNFSGLSLPRGRGVFVGSNFSGSGFVVRVNGSSSAFGSWPFLTGGLRVSGVGSECGCAPRSVSDACAGVECGVVSDGCAGFVGCGGCGSGEVCSSYHCCPSGRPVWDGSVCVECLSSGDCGVSKPYCVSEKCVECLSDGDCSGSTPVCDLTSHVCVACPSDRPKWDGSECVECLSDADCGSGYACDLTSHTCVEKSCTPKSRDEACGTWQCGLASDGCGGTVSCGSCGTGYSCDTTTHTCVESGGGGDDDGGGGGSCVSTGGSCSSDSECCSGNCDSSHCCPSGKVWNASSHPCVESGGGGDDDNGGDDDGGGGGSCVSTGGSCVASSSCCSKHCDNGHCCPSGEFWYGNKCVECRSNYDCLSNQFCLQDECVDACEYGHLNCGQITCCGRTVACGTCPAGETCDYSKGECVSN